MKSAIQIGTPYNWDSVEYGYRIPYGEPRDNSAYRIIDAGGSVVHRSSGGVKEPFVRLIRAGDPLSEIVGRQYHADAVRNQSLSRKRVLLPCDVGVSAHLVDGLRLYRDYVGDWYYNAFLIALCNNVYGKELTWGKPKAKGAGVGYGLTLEGVHGFEFRQCKPLVAGAATHDLDINYATNGRFIGCQGSVAHHGFGDTFVGHSDAFYTDVHIGNPEWGGGSFGAYIERSRVETLHLNPGATAFSASDSVIMNLRVRSDVEWVRSATFSNSRMLTFHVVGEAPGFDYLLFRECEIGVNSKGDVAPILFPAIKRTSKVVFEGGVLRGSEYSTVRFGEGVSEGAQIDVAFNGVVFDGGKYAVEIWNGCRGVLRFNGVKKLGGGELTTPKTHGLTVVVDGRVI